MRSRELWLTIAVAGGVLLVVALLGAGLLAPGEVTVTESPVPSGGIPDPPADGSTGVVMGSHQTESGLELLGIRFRAPSYAAFVAVAAPARCLAWTGDGEHEVVADGDCSSLPATGPLGGAGTTADGVSFVIVQVPISGACHEELVAGESWPTGIPECESGR